MKVFNNESIFEVIVNSNINANGKKRGKVEEVIITNYENERGFDNDW